LPAKPDRAILTHPLVVRAVAEYVLEKGAHILIADSPAMGSFERILKQGGYLSAFEGLNAEWMPFKNGVKRDIGPPFGIIDIAEEAVTADIVINLPKLKTHAQMLLTLGVKNLFGCIVGLKKSEWHLRAGVDREMFAKLLVRIHHAVNPSVTLIDGILALEGQGPGKGGTPRSVGMLIAGKYAPAVDAAICRMIGIDPEMLFTYRAAKELGLADDQIEIRGDFKRLGDFRLPVMGRIIPGPKPIERFMRKHLIQRPAVNQAVCKLCGECLDFCPAKAIAREKKRLIFDYDTCIRCYCCIEICPHGALRSTETLPGRVMRLFSRK
jgi:uncharacterized protein (DUF362 family)/NAD-dependent dihydropyrimidine dehydrogenase PreA subunit